MVELSEFALKAFTALILVTITRMVLENTRMSEMRLRARTAFKPINWTVGRKDQCQGHWGCLLKILTCANLHHKKYVDVLFEAREAGSEVYVESKGVLAPRIVTRKKSKGKGDTRSSVKVESEMKELGLWLKCWFLTCRRTMTATIVHSRAFGRKVARTIAALLLGSRDY